MAPCGLSSSTFTKSLGPDKLLAVRRYALTPGLSVIRKQLKRPQGSVTGSRPAGWNLLRPQRVRFQANPIIHRVSKSLFATQVAFRCLHRNVPKQELNLLQFSAGLVTEPSACPPKVVRCKGWKLALLGLLLLAVGVAPSVVESASREFLLNLDWPCVGKCHRRGQTATGPQDPTDEPVSELLKRIQTEKARLTKERLLRALCQKRHSGVDQLAGAPQSTP
jgi:hypothetical protein